MLRSSKLTRPEIFACPLTAVPSLKLGKSDQIPKTQRIDVHRCPSSFKQERVNVNLLALEACIHAQFMVLGVATSRRPELVFVHPQPSNGTAASDYELHTDTSKGSLIEN
jgi:hypothetical protein